MYQKYATIKGWKFEVLEQSEAEHGGLKVSEIINSILLISSFYVILYLYLRTFVYLSQNHVNCKLNQAK